MPDPQIPVSTLADPIDQQQHSLPPSSSNSTRVSNSSETGSSVDPPSSSSNSSSSGHNTTDSAHDKTGSGLAYNTSGQSATVSRQNTTDSRQDDTDSRQNQTDSSTGSEQTLSSRVQAAIRQAVGLDSGVSKEEERKNQRWLRGSALQTIALQSQDLPDHIEPEKVQGKLYQSITFIVRVQDLKPDKLIRLPKTKHRLIVNGDTSLSHDLHAEQADVALKNQDLTDHIELEKV